MKMNLLVLIGVFVTIGSTSAFVCPPNFCLSALCAQVENCNGRLEPKGGVCGCCPTCINQAAEGESCVSALVLLGVPTNTECGDNLYCNAKAGVCQKKSCAIKLAESATTLLGAPKPRCESDGTYSPVQCMGSKCYCVSKQGEQLYSDKPNGIHYEVAIGQQNNMKCDCAVDLDEYMKSGLIGRMFMCDNHGNYKKQ